MNFLIDDFKGWNKLDYGWLFLACAAIIGITLMMWAVFLLNAIYGLYKWSKRKA